MLLLFLFLSSSNFPSSSSSEPCSVVTQPSTTTRCSREHDVCGLAPIPHHHHAPTRARLPLLSIVACLFFAHTSTRHCDPPIERIQAAGTLPALRTMLQPPAPHDDNEDDVYNSASDSDFAPDAPTASDSRLATAHRPSSPSSSSSSSTDDDDEDNDTTRSRPSTKRSRHHRHTTSAAALSLDNSGDEATLSRARKKHKPTSKSTPPPDKHQQPRGGHADAESDSGSGGAGGHVKTRAQRRAEVVARRAPARLPGAASVDVDALWAQMAAAPLAAAPAPAAATTDDLRVAADAAAPEREHVYTFVGERVSVQSSSTSPVGATPSTAAPSTATQPGVATSASNPSSAHTASISTSTSTTTSNTNPSAPHPLRRPTKRRSIFPTATTPSTASTPAASSTTSTSAPAPPPTKRLTTLEKSALDWRAHVAHEAGLAAELSDAARARGAYLGRQDFLGRVDARRAGDEAEARRVARGR